MSDNLKDRQAKSFVDFSRNLEVANSNKTFVPTNYVREKHYYLTLEMSKLYDALVILFTYASPSGEMRVAYSCIQVVPGLYLDYYGYFMHFGDRPEMFNYKTITPLILSYDGAKKVLRDCDIKVTDTKDKKLCREWLRNHTPAVVALDDGNWRILGLNILNHFRGMQGMAANEDLLIDSDAYTDVLTFEYSNGIGGTKFRDLVYTYKGNYFKSMITSSVGWIPNSRWYEKLKR